MTEAEMVLLSREVMQRWLAGELTDLQALSKLSVVLLPGKWGFDDVAKAARGPGA